MFACNLKISAIAYLFSISFSTVFQQQRCQFFCQCFIIRYPGSVRPESHLPCAFMPCASEVNSNGRGFKRDIWNLALQPLKIYISTTAMLVANKLGRVVTYHERLLLTKSLDRLITLSCEILRQTENISHNQSAYAHQTWQYGNLAWWAPAHKVS